MHAIARTAELLREMLRRPSPRYRERRHADQALLRRLQQQRRRPGPTVTSSSRAEVHALAKREAASGYAGPAEIETYAVMFGGGSAKATTSYRSVYGERKAPSFAPTVAHLACRLPDGRRSWANVEDPDTLARHVRAGVLRPSGSSSTGPAAAAVPVTVRLALVALAGLAALLCAGCLGDLGSTATSAMFDYDPLADPVANPDSLFAPLDPERADTDATINALLARPADLAEPPVHPCLDRRFPLRTAVRSDRAPQLEAGGDLEPGDGGRGGRARGRTGSIASGCTCGPDAGMTARR